MRLRLTGTRGECAQFLTHLTATTAPGTIGEVSGFYPNRSDHDHGRVYLTLDPLPPDATATQEPRP